MHNMIWVTRFTFASAAALLYAQSALAAPPVIPGNADAGRVIEDMKQAPEPSVSAPSVATPPLLVDKAPPGAEQTQFTLHSVTIEGSENYGKNELAPIYQDYIGKKIPVSKVYDFAAAVSKKYRDDGYALSRAIVPPQELADGNVKIKVINGYINDVIIEGKYEKSELINNIAARIKTFHPLKIQDLEREMLLLNDLAGVSVQGILKLPKDNAKADDGATDLVLEFSVKHDSASLSYDNFGSRYIGPYEATAQANVSILPYQQTSVTGLVTTPWDELQYISAAHSIPLDSDGTTANFTASYAHSKPGYKLEDEDVKSRSEDFGIFVSHPFIRSRGENLYLGAGLEFKTDDTDVLEANLYRDVVRIASLDASYDINDNLGGANLATVKFSQGLDILGARETGSDNLSRANGHSDFTKVDATLSRLQEVDENFQLYLAASGQYSWSPLLSSEQFGYGGQQFGRAYDYSEITGDDGIAGAVELRYTSVPLFLNVSSQPFIFYDIGKVWNDGSVEDPSGSSAGFGVRFAHDDNLSGSVTVAKPLTKQEDAPDSGNSKAARIFFSLSCRF